MARKERERIRKGKGDAALSSIKEVRPLCSPPV